MRKTIYDINPEPEKKWFKFYSRDIQCSKCLHIIHGSIILDKKSLQVVDTSGFMIFENEIECDDCCNVFVLDFEESVIQFCEELGSSPDELGIEGR